MHMKQLQHSQQGFSGSMNSSPPVSCQNSLDFLKGSGDSLDFRDLNLKQGDTGSPQQQSRLTTWKLNSFQNDRNSEAAADIFAKPLSSRADSTSNTWGMTSAGWGEDTSAKLTATGESAAVASSTGSKFPEIIPEVPEFTPGKPWRGGSQMKSVEEDPHLTP